MDSDTPEKVGHVSPFLKCPMKLTKKNDFQAHHIMMATPTKSNVGPSSCLGIKHEFINHHHPYHPIIPSFSTPRLQLQKSRTQWSQEASQFGQCPVDPQSGDTVTSTESSQAPQSLGIRSKTTGIPSWKLTYPLPSHF